MLSRQAAGVKHPAPIWKQRAHRTLTNNSSTVVKEVDAMQTGVVKWFNNAKGYGFILSEESSGDIFAHYSAINMDGYKTLKAGQQVQFTTEDGPKGIHAVGIQSVDDDEAPGPIQQDDVPHTAPTPDEEELA